jgi:hypothetical protein
VITTCFSIGSPMSKEAQDWVHAERVRAEYVQELAAGDDDITRSAGIRRGLYDQGPIFGGLPAGIVVQVRHRNDPFLLFEISIRATAIRAPCVND